MTYDPHSLLTYSGKFVNPLDIHPEDLCLQDIAHALALRSRFGGHCATFYSVAQHCCLAAMFTKESRPLALLHDAAEAYLCDVPGPLKCQRVFDFFHTAELTILDTIIDKYCPDTRRGSWERIDMVLLVNEFRQLFPHTWPQMPIAANTLLAEGEHIEITPWTWQESERMFLAIAASLGMKD